VVEGAARIPRLRARLTDADEFVALYRRESQLVLMFCARRVLDPEIALDLTAETFAQAFRGRRGFRGTTEVEARAWLLTIARRQIARYLRRGALDRGAIERLGIQVPRLEPGEAEEIERRASLPQLRAAVAAALEHIGDDQREALRLRVVEERSYEQIADILGVNETTARARVSRGLRALQGALDSRAVTEATS
jgi:RNA polymerase sigma-70 factor (ECF subfamily)